jgi:hypothetical protein
MTDTRAADPQRGLPRWLVQLLITALLSALGGGVATHAYHTGRRADAPAAAPGPDRPAVEADRAPDEAPAPREKRGFGWVRPADLPERGRAGPAAADLLPPSLDLMAPGRELPEGLPFYQGSIGSCGPCSAAAAILYADVKAGRKGLPPPSRLFIYYTTRRRLGTIPQDSGVSNAAMVRALAESGYCDEDLCPYAPRRFRERPTEAAFAQAAGRKLTDARPVPQDLDAMRACLAAGRPIIVGFAAYPSLVTEAVDRTGLIPLPGDDEERIGGHDVLVVGYDDDRQAFRVLNSWGAHWGEGGFGWLPYAYALDPRLAGDFWTIGSGR